MQFYAFPPPAPNWSTASKLLPHLPFSPSCLLAYATLAHLHPPPESLASLRPPSALTRPPGPLAQCLFVVCIILLFEVNCFFLKFELWVPPINPLNTYRLIILFFMALPALKVCAGPPGRLSRALFA
jgi:hypothetical protein